MLRRRIVVAVFTVVAAASMLASVATAQEEMIELLRSDLKTQKVAILTEAMQFGPGQADIFWPIYREYDIELAKNGDAMVALIKDYAANYANMTEPKAKELAERAFKIEENRIKLRQSYFKKVEKAIDSTTAARFAQVERQIGLLVDLQIAAEMPLIRKPAQQ